MHIARYTNQATKDAVVNEQLAQKKSAEASAKQSEYEHRAKPRQFDDDEMLAMCGLPPRRR